MGCPGARPPEQLEGRAVGSWIAAGTPGLGGTVPALMGHGKLPESPARDGWNLAQTSLMGDRDESGSGGDCTGICWVFCTGSAAASAVAFANAARFPSSISAALLRISSTRSRGGCTALTDQGSAPGKLRPSAVLPCGNGRALSAVSGAALA